MSNVARVAGQAANTLTKPLNVEEVFSTYLWEGSSTARDITNGIDLAGEGGLVWIKWRSGSNAVGHQLYTEPEDFLASELTSTLNTGNTTRLNAFNSDGFSLGNSTEVNYSGDDYASWTFRKAPKFFDVVTYTGDSTAGRTVSHNLGSVPGMIVVKCITNTTNWMVYHRGLDATAPENKYIRLNLTNAVSDSTIAWNDTAPTSTEFTLGSHTLVNGSGQTYVAYLFAHNDGDGEFGPDGDADIIKCGSYTGNDGTQDIDLGFEPAWVLVKSSSNTRDWKIIDNMRGFAASPNNKWLTPNSSNSEENINASASTIEPTATGFRLTTGDAETNSSGWSYIYIAIRRGPMAVPEDATDVFAVDDVSNGASEPDSISGFPVDFVLRRYINTTNNWVVCDRLRNHYHLKTNSTDAEAALNSSTTTFDYMNGVNNIFSSNNADFYHWMWKRAPGFFDVVAYTGNGPSVNTVKHNLGVKPEMIWIKGRDTTFNWSVFHDMTASDFKRQYLNLSNGDNNVRSYDSNYGLYSEPTDTQIQIDDIDADLYNGSGQTYIAYLFASLNGVSKVGSYVGDGTHDSHVIDCGFTSGARFVLLKRTDAVSDWFVWDSERGITTGADSRLILNSSAAEYTGLDDIRPHSSGFIAANPNGSDVNALNSEWIFYAVA